MSVWEVQLKNVAAHDLLFVIRSLQNYLLSLSQDCSFFFHTGASKSQCCDMLESFGEAALLTTYDFWNFVDFEKNGDIDAVLEKQCKSVRGKNSRMVPADVAAVNVVLSTRNSKPARRPRFDVDETSRAGRAKSLANILKDKAKKFHKAGSLKEYFLFVYIC